MLLFWAQKPCWRRLRRGFAFSAPRCSHPQRTHPAHRPPHRMGASACVQPTAPPADASAPPESFIERMDAGQGHGLHLDIECDCRHRVRNAACRDKIACNEQKRPVDRETIQHASKQGTDEERDPPPPLTADGIVEILHRKQHEQKPQRSVSIDRPRPQKIHAVGKHPAECEAAFGPTDRCTEGCAAGSFS